MYDSLMNDVNYYWVLLALVFSFFGFFVRAWRWKLLIEPLGFKPSKYNLVNAVIIGYLANIPLPRFGEIARCGSLYKTDKIPVDSLIGTVIIERIIDVLSLLILIALVIVVKIDKFGHFFKEKVFIPWYNTLFISIKFWVFIILIIAIILIVLFIYKNKIRKLAVYKKILSFIKGIISGFRTFISLKKRGKFIFLTILLWFTYLMMTYVVFFSITQTSSLTLLDGLFILIAGSIGMTAPVQGGFGAYHWMVSLGLLLYGIDQATGLLYATVCHESQIILIVILGCISMYMVFGGSRKKSKNPIISN
jgi:glycosyltransferase 2 family protein